jgi:acyl carrier protein
MLTKESKEKRQRLVSFIQSELSKDFDPAAELLAVLDSVAFLRIVMFVESAFGVTLDMSHMSAENFRTVDTLVETIEQA